MNQHWVNCPDCGRLMESETLSDGVSRLYSCPVCLATVVHSPPRVRLLELVLTSVYNRVEGVAACPRDDVDKLSDMTEALRVLVENALDADKEAAVMDMLKMDGTISK